MDHPSPPQLPQHKPTAAPGHFRLGNVLSRWWWLAASVIAVIVGTAYKIPDWFEMRGPLYQSTALVEVQPIRAITSAPSSPSTASSSPAIHGNHFFNTQREIIGATATLERALKKSDLINRLGGSQTAALERMKSSTTTSQRRGTDLLEVTYQDEDPQVAQDAATAIYESYTERRTELEAQLRKDEIKALELQLKNKRDHVQELRIKFKEIEKELNVEAGENTRSKKWGEIEEQSRKAVYDTSKEIEQLTFQIKRFENIDDDLLVQLAADLPDVAIKENYNKYVIAKKNVQTLRESGLAEEHPVMRLKKAVVVELKDDLKKRVSAFRSGMQERVKKLRDGLKDAEKWGVHEDVLAENGMVFAKKEMETLKKQLSKLMDLDDEELIRIASDLPYVGFARTYKEFIQAQEDYEALRATGLAEKHPDLELRRQALDELKTSLLKRAKNVRESLKYKLELIQKRIDEMKAIVNNDQDRGTRPSSSAKEFNAARKEYQTANRLLEEFETKFQLESIKPGSSSMIHVLHESPQLPTAPVTKGHKFFTILLTAIAIPFSIIGSLILIYLAEAVFPRRAKI